MHSPSLPNDCSLNQPSEDALRAKSRRWRIYAVVFATLGILAVAIRVIENVESKRWQEERFLKGLESDYFLALNRVSAFDNALSVVVPEKISFCQIPEGAFVIGEEGDPTKPQHPVRLRAFSIGSKQVQSSTWDYVLNWALVNGYTFENRGGSASLVPQAGTPDRPRSEYRRYSCDYGSVSYSGGLVAGMNWHDAVKWCNAMSEKEGLRACYYKSHVFSSENVFRSGEVSLTNEMVDWNADGYRLPTEAEWEVAFKETQAGAVPVQTAGRPQSLIGVWEWCWDCYSKDPVPKEEDPRGPETGSFRVARDGTRVDKMGFYARMELRPDLGASYRGFRVVRRSI